MAWYFISFSDSGRLLFIFFLPPLYKEKSSTQSFRLTAPIGDGIEELTAWYLPD